MNKVISLKYKLWTCYGVIEVDIKDVVPNYEAKLLEHKGDE